MNKAKRIGIGALWKNFLTQHPECWDEVYVSPAAANELLALSSGAAFSEVLNEAREYSYSTAYGVSAHTRKLRENWEDWVSVQKRIIFKQTHGDGTKVRTLRLDTDLVLDDEN